MRSRARERWRGGTFRAERLVPDPTSGAIHGVRAMAPFERHRGLWRGLRPAGERRRRGDVGRNRQLALEVLELRVTPTTSTWSGTVDGSWMNAANWDVAPAAGNDLVFPATAMNQSNTNDLPGQTSFASLSLASTTAAGGYTIGATGGSSIALTGAGRLLAGFGHRLRRSADRARRDRDPDRGSEHGDAGLGGGNHGNAAGSPRRAGGFSTCSVPTVTAGRRTSTAVCSTSIPRRRGARSRSTPVQHWVEPGPSVPSPRTRARSAQGPRHRRS